MRVGIHYEHRRDHAALLTDHRVEDLALLLIYFICKIAIISSYPFYPMLSIPNYNYNAGGAML